VPSAARISSRQHDVVQRFRRAARGIDRAGKDAGVVLLDGAHLLAEALDAGVPVELVLSDERAHALVGRARAAGASVYEGTAGVLEAASPVRTPSGIVALARWTTAPLADALGGSAACCLGLAGVQDPGNVGSAIRAADALGATGVLALDATADPRGWKTLRGAMGSSFRLPVARATTADAVAEARRRGLRVIATVATLASGGTAIESADLRSPALLLVGSEGAGLGHDVVSSADLRVTIPMRDGVDSLNVAVSAAILLFEARRQRQRNRA
jgi:TrmH family RNA methyltransferase